MHCAVNPWYKRLKVRTFIYCCLQGNQNSSSLQIKVAYWPALAVSSAAQLAAAHHPNERTVDLQSAAAEGRQNKTTSFKTKLKLHGLISDAHTYEMKMKQNGQFKNNSEMF